jgi:hypothetical protein
MRRPIYECEVLCREQLAGLAVEDVEKTILRRLHDHRPARAIDLHVGED